MEIIDRCELCEGTDFFPLLKGRDRLHGIGGEFQLVKCQRCGLIFVNPRPDKGEMKQFYPAAYGPHAKTGGPSHSHRLSPLRRRIYSLFYNYPYGNRGNGTLLKLVLWPVKWVTVRNMIPFQGEGKILDIGAGSGSFLGFMKTLGWDPYGVDISAKAMERVRALGARSILAEPRAIEIKDILNKSVKSREPWRPFPPSFLTEDFGEYVENPYASSFMIIAFQGKDGIVQNIQGATHVDRTVRAQTVERRIQPKYWEVINEFKKLAGVLAVLNTSLNVAGQPIGCTLFDALSTFFACGLDYLAIGDLLIWK